MTESSGAGPEGILAQLAERVSSGSSLDATARRLAADSSAAGDADRLARRAGVAELLADGPSPLVAITRTLAAVPLIAGHAAELDPVEVLSELESGHGVAELALRHGMAGVGNATPLPPDSGGLVGPTAKIIRAELGLPADVSQEIAARFVGSYLLLSFMTNVRAFFEAEAISEARAALAQDGGPVADFVRACWDRA